MKSIVKLSVRRSTFIHVDHVFSSITFRCFIDDELIDLKKQDWLLLRQTNKYLIRYSRSIYDLRKDDEGNDLNKNVLEVLSTKYPNVL